MDPRLIELKQLDAHVHPGHRGVRDAIAETRRYIHTHDLLYMQPRRLDGVLRVGPLKGEYVYITSNYSRGDANRRARYSQSYVCTREAYEAALASLPSGWSTDEPALDGELSVPVCRGELARVRWSEGAWRTCGVILRRRRVVWLDGALESVLYWEHGKDAAECDLEAAQKSDAARADAWLYRRDRRDERRAHLVARLCRLPVTAEMVHQAGACKAGIEAWCAAREIDINSSLPLSTLAKDLTAFPYALRIARLLEIRPRSVRRPD